MPVPAYVNAYVLEVESPTVLLPSAGVYCQVANSIIVIVEVGFVCICLSLSLSLCVCVYAYVRVCVCVLQPKRDCRIDTPLGNKFQEKTSAL